MSHIPVLLTEMLCALAPKDGETYVDATFGGGGYSRAILEAANCQVVAFDRDPEAVDRARALVKDYPTRFQIKQGRFSQLKELLEGLGLSKVHGFVFDLGVSSDQIDSPERGFSFRFEGPLDMRMSSEGLSAADVVNTYSEQELADIIYRYGEEKRSRAIARKIVATRKEEPLQTTNQLANLVKSVVKGTKDGQNPATLTFQALRIYVNNELIEVDSGLKIAEECLLPGGRLVVVTFHSLEDRLVKQFLKARQGNRQGSSQSISRYLPEQSGAVKAPTFARNKGAGVSLKGNTPSLAELKGNPRARSARLRTAVRLSSLNQPLTVNGRGN
ncbi:MAG: 16S rRNA (cytosine(1402)-N(4))-methyltransferase RsmH [Alphaproteobacteria bacterium]|jgi:16S rRNA (cytosine1402-N4)-methyltransferase|nr:16S rRNA (cytosine(1402)-N(4))-methyltransferase RsmH [Alphaproteobacteria bacterium]